MARKICLKCFLIFVFICLNVRVVFSVSLDGILDNNKYIELGNKNKQVVKLKIKRDGLYAIKSSGTNDIIIDLVSKNNEKIKPDFIEHDGNVFATYLLNSDRSYYANIKMRLKDNGEKSKLGLYFLDDADIIDGKSVDGEIEAYGEDKYFKYIPKDDCTYMIKSVGNIDLNASIYDDRGVKLQSSSDICGLNFRILEELNKDKCYYIRIWSTHDKGNFKLEIDKKKPTGRDIIDLEMNDDLEDDFFGYVKKGESSIKFIPNVDGQYKFILMSEVKLSLDIQDEQQKSIVKQLECSDNYSFAIADVEKGNEYVIKINSDLDAIGLYRLRILNFSKLRRHAKDIIIGENKGFISMDNEYLRFVCQSDGVYSFENIGEHDIAIDFYNENGKLLKGAERNLGVLKGTFGIKANKGDILYLKVRDIYYKLRDFEYEIEVNNFCDLTNNCYSAGIGEISGYSEKLGQRHFYKFVPTKGGTYFIKSNCDKFLRCRLYDGEGYLMRESLKNLDFIIAYELRKGETYYISIEDLVGIGEFCFEIVSIDEIYKTKIQEDVCVYNEIEYLGELKQYEFCASEEGVYLIDVDSLANVNVVKRDENGNTIENMNLKKGDKCVIEISGENSPLTMASYGLKVYNFTNKLKNAKEIVCDKEYEGNIIIPGVKDNYSFIPKTSGYYSICTVSDLDMTSKIYNSKGELIVESKEEDDFNLCIVAKLEKGEKYLITINEKTGKETCIYALVIEQNKKSEIDPEWIKVDKTKLGVLRYDGEEKIYKIVIPKSGRYFVDNYLSLNLDIEVSDESDNIVEKLNKNDIANRNLYELNENSLYYIKVKAKDGVATGMYSLKIQNVEKAYKGAKLLMYNLENIKKTNAGEASYYKFEVRLKCLLNISKEKGERLYVELLDKEGNIIVGCVLEEPMNMELDRGFYYLRCFSSSDSEIKVF